MPARFGKFKENDTREVKELVHGHEQISPQTTLTDPKKTRMPISLLLEKLVRSAVFQSVCIG